MGKKYSIADMRDEIFVGLFHGACRTIEEMRHAYFHVTGQKHKKSRDMFSVCYYREGEEPHFTIHS